MSTLTMCLRDYFQTGSYELKHQLRNRMLIIKKYLMPTKMLAIRTQARRDTSSSFIPIKITSYCIHQSSKSYLNLKMLKLIKRLWYHATITKNIDRHLNVMPWCYQGSNIHHWGYTKHQVFTSLNQTRCPVYATKPNTQLWIKEIQRTWRINHSSFTAYIPNTQ